MSTPLVFTWRPTACDPLQQAEIVLLGAWVERLESESVEHEERRQGVGLDR